MKCYKCKNQNQVNLLIRLCNKYKIKFHADGLSPEEFDKRHGFGRYFIESDLKTGGMGYGTSRGQTADSFPEFIRLFILSHENI